MLQFESNRLLLPKVNHMYLEPISRPSPSEPMQTRPGEQVSWYRNLFYGRIYCRVTQDQTPEFECSASLMMEIGVLERSESKCDRVKMLEELALIRLRVAMETQSVKLFIRDTVNSRNCLRWKPKASNFSSGTLSTHATAFLS